MTFAIVLALILVVSTFAFHQRVMLWLGHRVPPLAVGAELKLLLIVVALYAAHVVEISAYALVYAWAGDQLELGVFQGQEVTHPMSYLYYSGVVYTSLGFGDIYPEGHLRFITAMEALNGLMLITWSASFTFLAMGRLWPTWSCSDAAQRGKELG